MNRPMIDAEGPLAALVERLCTEDRVALDVEGDGLYRYRSRLCTAQLAAAGVEAVVDTLALEDLTPLAPLLSREGPMLVVHDVSFDARMLESRGLRLENVFDTSVAARYLGEQSTGLAAMLEKHFGVVLDKAYQQADWGERPLPEDRFEYLLSDVRHLSALSEILEASALERDIMEEIREETRYALARALEPEAIREPWTRIKLARDFDPRQRSLLKALADLREEEAEARDVPPFRVVSNRVLFEAVRRRPRTVAELGYVRGMRALGEPHLRAALAIAHERGPLVPEPPPPPPPPEERAARKARERALSVWRAQEAETRGVDVQVVLPGHCLRDLVGLDALTEEGLRSIAGLGDKRIDRYGRALLQCLEPSV